jgi:hypothetical protein
LQNKQLQKKITQLKSDLLNVQEKLEQLETNNDFSKLPTEQQDVVKQFISNSVAKKHGER